MQKTLFDIEKQSWTKVRDSYFKLLKLAQDNNWLLRQINKDTIWGKLEKICDFLNSVNEGVEMSYQEKHVLFSVGTEDISDFIRKINILEDNFPLDSNQKNSFDDFVLFVEQKVNEKRIDDPSFLQVLKDVKFLEVTLENQFEIILYILGQKNFVTPYSIEEFIDFFSNIEKADTGRFIGTLISVKHDEKDIYSFIEFIFENIIGDEETTDAQNEEVWFNWLVIYYALDLVWFHFSKLSDLQKDYLLKNYFYRSIVIGLPIEKFISDYLSESLDIVEFVYRHKKIIDSIDTNEEDVLIDLQNNSFDLFINLLKKYIALNKNSYLDGYRMNEFLNNLYNNSVGREPYINWLRESFALYLTIKESLLVDWDQVVVSDEIVYNYEKEMSKAVFCFIFGDTFLNNIVNLLQEKKFGLSALLKTIKDVVDLNNEKDIERVTNLDSILKQNNLLSTDKDLISFDEVKDEFIWNNDLKV